MMGLEVVMILCIRWAIYGQCRPAPGEPVNQVERVYLDPEGSQRQRTLGELLKDCQLDRRHEIRGFKDLGAVGGWAECKVR